MIKIFAIFTAVLDYIENRISEDISDADLAELAGFSNSHFRVLFKEATGQTLARYIRRRKLSHAALKLTHSDDNIIDIALSTGFNSHDSFTRAFRREFKLTPVEFRKNKNQIKSKVIIPGIYGPSVISKKGIISNENSSNNNSFIDDKLPDNIKASQMESTTLYGVPGFAKGENTPFIASLRSCLTYLGQHISYARLMASSGAAFRMVWKRNCWYEGNIDIMDMYDDPTIPIRHTLNTVGRNFILLSKSGEFGFHESEIKESDRNSLRIGAKNDFKKIIKKEINSGRPLIGFGIIGPPEACIVTGYKEDAEELIGWNFFQEMPKFAGDIEIEPCGYFRRKNWYEHRDTIAIMTIGDSFSVSDEKEIIKRTLNEAVNIMEGYQSKEYARGFAAFQAWREALLDDSQFPKKASLLKLIERVICHLDLCTMIGEGRWNAHLYIKEIDHLFPNATKELNQVSSFFKKEYKLIEQMYQMLGGYGMGEKEARKLAKKDVRIEMASLVDKILNLDKNAARKLIEVLKIIK
ncbi:MAG: helix-turn-helix domain-containing protein [bacterium]